MAMILGIASGVIGAVGALQQASAQSAAAEYNADVAKRNRDAVRAQTEVAVEDKMIENRRQLGSVRAAYGSSGLMLDGSPLDVLQDTAVEQAYDVRKLKYQGRMKAAGYTEQAALSKLEAKSARTAGWIGAGSSIISGVSQGMRDWGGGGGGEALAGLGG